MEKVAYFLFGKTSKSNWIIGILLLAAFLRLYKIQDYMTFLGDEGRDALVVYNILHGHLTLLGPTASVGGFFLGPIYYYLMAPFLWVFNYNPVGPAIMVALFGIATVWLVYKVGSEFFGREVGLIAAFLYSISPLTIAYSRSSWNPNLMPFFSLLSLYVLYKAVTQNKTKLFIFCGFLLGISMQLHYLAIFLGVIMVIYVFLSRYQAELVSASIKIRIPKSEIGNNVQNSNFPMFKTRVLDFWSFEFISDFVLRILRDYLYIFLGFIIGWLPFLAFEIRHGFPNIRSILSFIFNSGDTGGNIHFFSTIYNVFFRLFARLVTNFPPPEQILAGMHKNITLWYYGTLLLGAVSVLIFLFKCLKAFREHSSDSSKLNLLLIWLVFGIGLFGLYKKPIYDYYFGFMFPLPFMLIGLTISSFYGNFQKLIFIRHSGEERSDDSRIRPVSSRSERFWTSQNDRKRELTGKILAVGIFIVLAWINFRSVPFRFLPNRQLAQVEEISRFVIDKTENKPFNFALIASGNSDHAYRYFFTLWNRDPVTIENPQKDPQRNTLTNQLLVVCETNPCAPLGYSLWEVAGFGRAEIVNEWSVSVVKVYKLGHYKDVDTSDGGRLNRAKP